MKGVNRVTLLGTVGKDPEVKTLDGGVKVAKFSLATNESYKDKNGQKIENTEWHNLSAWNKLAEIIEQYVKKGNNLYVEGKIKYRSYEKNGVKQYYTDIVIDVLTMLPGGTKQEGNSSPQVAREQTKQQEQEYLGQPPNDDSDLPF